MTKRPFAVLSGSAVGIALALTFINSDRGSQQTSIQHWQGSAVAGSTDADFLTRARVARQALLALNETQTVYFSTMRDSDGALLDGECEYRMQGEGLPARWWSITAYGEDYFLIPNKGDQYSVTMQEHGDGPWQVTIAADGQASLMAPTSGGFNLLLRLYNPNFDVFSDLEKLRLPVIEKIWCA